MDRYTVAVVLDIPASEYAEARVKAEKLVEHLNWHCKRYFLDTNATLVVDYEKDNSGNRLVYLGNEYGNVVE